MTPQSIPQRQRGVSRPSETYRAFRREALKAERRLAKKLAKPKKAEPLDPTRPLPEGLSWYVFTTNPNQEYAVAQWLEKNGLMTLTPLETRIKLRGKMRGGQKQPRDIYQVPLFPRLVLCGFNARPNWYSIMDHHHITGVLGINKEPMAMRKGEAERIRESSEALRVPTESKPLQIGGKALVVAPGLFVGHVVEITSLAGKFAEIKQNWFGQERTVKVKVDDLEAA